MTDIDEALSQKSANEKLKDFSDLLKTIKNVDEKKKQLWLEIYNNAIIDRSNSHLMFQTLSKIVQENSTEFAVHGKTLATFIEKMSRANDQLIKLAELIAEADSKEDEIDPDDMFEQINKNSKH